MSPAPDDDISPSYQLNLSWVLLAPDATIYLSYIIMRGSTGCQPDVKQCQPRETWSRVLMAGVLQLEVK